MEIFQQNLDQLAFRTPTGKRQADVRLAYARDFLQGLKEEL